MLRVLTIRHWVLIGCGILVAGALFMLIRAGRKKSFANDRSDAVPTKTNDDAALRKVNKLESDISESLTTPKQAPATVNAPTIQQNPYAQQNAQALAYEQYYKAMEADINEQRHTSDDAKYSPLALSFSDHDTTGGNSALSYADPRPNRLADDASAKIHTDVDGSFVCGSESNYWTACVKEGDAIQTVTDNALQGDFTGPVITHTTQVVMSYDRKHILIPVGTVILGEAGRVQDSEQERLAIVFHRMILRSNSDYHPAGWSIDLDKLQGLSPDGSAGEQGHVNRHLMSTILAAGAYGALAGFALEGTGSALTTSGVGLYRQGLSEQLGMEGENQVSRFLNRMPTISVPIGTRCDVYLSKDLVMR